MTQIVLPELGEGIEEATIVTWFVKPGDMVALDQDVVEVVTDKASFNVPAQVSGRVKHILVKEGDKVKIGEPLAVIE